MNFYRRFPGDYQRDTGHLSLAEHGAYSLMLDHHYATEKPLPTGKALYRLLRCDSEEERQAVDSVVDQFWCEVEGALVNPKAEKELDRASRRRLTNKENGKLGGRPQKPKENPTGNREETQKKPNGLAKKKQTESNTRHQTPEIDLSNDKSIPKGCSEDDIRVARDMVEEIRDLYESQTINFGKWVNTIRLLREVDKLTHSQIVWLWRWIRQDNFWSDNIRSPMKLRKRNEDGLRYWEVCRERAKREYDERQTKGRGNDGSRPGSNEDRLEQAARALAENDDLGAGD